MTTKEIEKKIERIEYYMRGTDSLTQFYDACSIARNVLYELKIANAKILDLEKESEGKNTNFSNSDLIELFELGRQYGCEQNSLTNTEALEETKFDSILKDDDSSNAASLESKTDKETINSFFAVTLSHFPDDLPTSNNLDKNISDLRARLKVIEKDYTSDYGCGECTSPESCQRHQTCHKERA